MEHFHLPWWKKKLSNFIELPLETINSEISGQLTVSLHKEQYMLSANQCIYSFGSLYYNFTKTFLQFDFDNLKGNDVLVLGMGLASIPLMLENDFYQDFDYTLIEIDEDIIYLAEKYVLHQLESYNEVIHADALIYSKITKKKFDIICIDIFLDAIIPEEFEQIEFIQNIKKMLKPEGVVIFNRLGKESTQSETSNQYFEKIFLPIFPNAVILPIGHNLMLISNQNFILK